VLLLIAPPIYWFAGVPAFETDYLSFLRYGCAASGGQIIYMGWVRGRVHCRFYGGNPCRDGFCGYATLLSAVVKPFGRRFKITDKAVTVPRLGRIGNSHRCSG